MEAASVLDPRGTPMAKDEKLLPESASESSTLITENSSESLARYLQNSVAEGYRYVLHDIETARKGCDWDYIKGEVV